MPRMAGIIITTSKNKQLGANNMKHLTNLITTITNETVDYSQVVNNSLTIDAQFVLIAISGQPTVIEQLNTLTFNDYEIVIDTVVEDANWAVFGRQYVDY